MPKLIAFQVIKLSKVVQRYFSREEDVQSILDDVLPVFEINLKGQKILLPPKKMWLP